jgi:hypothetical protein
MTHIALVIFDYSEEICRMKSASCIIRLWLHLASYSMDFFPSNFLVVVQVAEFVLISFAKKEHCIDKEFRNICSFQFVRGPRGKTLILLFSNQFI